MNLDAELEACRRMREAEQEAHRRFGIATHADFERYNAAWQPLREKWEASAKPHFDILQAELLRINKVYKAAIEEARR